MRTRPCLMLADVKRIAAAAQAEALRNQWNVAIAILDDGGHLLGFLRIALRKARTAALSRRPSKAWEDRVAGGRLARERPSAPIRAT